MIKRNNPYFTKEVMDVVEREKDYNNCSVVALHVVTGKPYKECYDFMKTFRKSKSKRVSLKGVEDSLTRQKGVSVKMLEYSTSNKISIKKFVESYPEGTYYCQSHGHAFAIVDGVLFDHSDKPRRMIFKAMQVSKVGEV